MVSYTYRNTKKSTSPELLTNVPELLPRKSVDMFDTVMVMKNHTSQIMYTWGKLIINKIILHVNIIYDVHT